MNFFDDLKKGADTLVSESAEILKTTRGYKAALEKCANMLENKFSP